MKTLRNAVFFLIAACFATSSFSCSASTPPSTAPTTNRARSSGSLLQLDWDEQINDESLTAQRIEGMGLARVRARVERRFFPFFDVTSIGGPNDRWADFRLLDDQRIPHFLDVRVVRLTSTVAGITSKFVVVGGVYTLSFTRNGCLFDVVDKDGRSGQLGTWR